MIQLPFGESQATGTNFYSAQVSLITDTVTAVLMNLTLI